MGFTVSLFVTAAKNLQEKQQKDEANGLEFHGPFPSEILSKFTSRWVGRSRRELSF